MKQSEIELRLREYINRSHLEESSVEVLVRSIRWFTELHGPIGPDEIGYGHMDDFRSWLRKGRSGSTANTYMAMTKGFFSWMFKRRYIRNDPFEGIKRYSKAGRQFDIYTPDEIRRILMVADPRWRTIVCLALSSMRRGEILNLHVSDIDFEKNEIHIQPKVRTATTWPWHIKNHDEALVGIDESIARLLIDMIERLDGPQPYVILKPEYYKRNIAKQEEGKLTHRGRNLPWGNFNRDFKSLLRRAKVQDKRFHDLRGTFASERYRDGFELVDLQFLMRHKSIQTTALYVKKEEARKLLKRSSRTFKKYYATNFVP